MLKLNKFDSGCWVIVLTTALFVLPIMLSGVLYQDDILRTANGEAYWGALGRPLSDVAVMALGFGSGFVVDSFPLSLILAGVLLGASSVMLYCRFAINRGIASGVVFSLFSLSPFFLQNLSYHFDSFPMMLGVFLAVLPYSKMAASFKLAFRVLFGAVCLVLALSLYQATINVFLSLCAIEITFALYSWGNGIDALRMSVERAASAIIGMIIYMKGVTPFFLSKNVHSDLVLKADDPAKSLFYNFERFWNIASSLMNDSLYMAWVLIIIVAIVGLIILSFRVAKSDFSLPSKIIGFAMFASGIAVALFSIAGPFIFVDKTVVAPRVMMGLPGFMLLIGYLASILSSKKITTIVCIIPVMFSLSYSSAYGNASKHQRSLEDKVFYDIASSLPPKLDGKKVYISGQISTAVATNMEFKRFPSLKWMVMPLYNWSGMVMLKHYGVKAEMGIPEMTKEKATLTQKRYFNIYAEKDIHIELQ
ncbi:glucosyltransferase domain-containing protein [Mixta hanseatica]|uniref:Glucosyltransferase domain-containing protein n=1 Tax=Mixta hanseatica TaxID=2872648 RepID=A0ABY4RA66_9GAMM|nr:glucosyltransferase domain-containing protein [Mixta hanseatica]UQY45313.1 glucosyltransferase domain-containing protein [Mixta hanseatica]